MQTGFVKENLKKYFDFYKTRRFNSINVYEIFPDLRYVNGQVTGRFDDLSELAKALNESHLKGKFFIDLRNIGHWANSVSIKLDQLAGKVPAGDIGVTIEQGTMIVNIEERYSEKAKEIYAQAIRLLLKQSKEENWPDIMVFADEELGNRNPWKIVNYESYMPVIMKECPELAAVIDNGIGWGNKNAIEFAVRDQVKHRQYNSWSEESLAIAQKDDAEVWTFNYGPFRLAFGLAQLRMNSHGHHQWADLWDSYNFQWQFSRLSDKGVVTSLQIERMYEGIVDYASGVYLMQLIAKQEKLEQKISGRRQRCVCIVLRQIYRFLMPPFKMKVTC